MIIRMLQRAIITLIFVSNSMAYFGENRPPIVNHFENKSSLASKTDIESVINKQSPVRSQGQRGACTMFTTIGLIESYLIGNGISSKSIDLSEEWMQYTIMRNKETEGSSTSKNLREVLNSGVVYENTWPYLGKKWLTLDDYVESRQTCEHLEGNVSLLKRCLLGHRDPRLYDMPVHQLIEVDPKFEAIRSEAMLLKDQLIKNLYKKKSSYRVKTTAKIRELLIQGKPLIMGTKLYYGSWNSSKVETYDIQPRDKDTWYQGIVGYPEVGSRDREISAVNGGGHSITIVGYDDDVIVKTNMLMTDGSTKEFSYKGVYYFKNSWGVKGFGKKFILNNRSYPGYGMITQKYANEFGTFYSIE
ncbi:C1 family peptidase [Bacteriovorax sp. Seq25_V]|uniref:C1 family peptidase n=1 Tax=Bacteriovorax sp. Seq25_V TaxID=1201288 RepID=UPI00038A2422|nr:C1 family peptidase [Bacteriovorax sp. Seq25_V]EQC44026.1 papain family cysteine protease domain protein [Bacteriovorax sp. Seq25_V]